MAQALSNFPSWNVFSVFSRRSSTGSLSVERDSVLSGVVVRGRIWKDPGCVCGELELDDEQPATLLVLFLLGMDAKFLFPGFPKGRKNRYFKESFSAFGGGNALLFWFRSILPRVDERIGKKKKEKSKGPNKGGRRARLVSASSFSIRRNQHS